MGCSASTHAGVGIYSVTNDDLGECDQSWRPRPEDFDVNKSYPLKRPASKHKQQGRGQRLQSNAKRKGNRAGKPACAPTAACQQGCSQLEEGETPCGALVPMVCQKEMGSSPERIPLPSNHNHHILRNGDHGNGSAGASSSASSSSAATAAMQPLQQLNESLTSWNQSILAETSTNSLLNNSPQHVTESPGETRAAFSNRRWMVLPEHQYDMNAVHPALPPFLGSMYWTAASPLPGSAMQRQRRQHQGRAVNVNGSYGCPPSIPTIGKHPPHQRGSERHVHVPSLITPGSSAGRRSPASPFTRIGIRTRDVHNQCQSHPSPRSTLAKHRSEKLLLSLNSTMDWSEATSVSSEADDDDEEEEEDEFGDCHGSGIMNPFSPWESADISRELLNYSHLEDSYILEPQGSHQTPRRLFDEDAEDLDVELNQSFEVEYAGTPTSRLRHRQQCSNNGASSQAKVATQRLQSFLCMAPNLTSATISFSSSDDNTIISEPPTPRERMSVSPSNIMPHSPPQCPSSPSVATFYGHWGSRRERHVSTLPSSNYGGPIRLRVTESGLSGGHSNHHHHHQHSSNTGSRSSNSNSSGIHHTMSNHTHTSSPGDFFSYDPYFSTGKYTVTLPNGKPYGNGLVMKMGWQFMILEDSRGVVLAAIKSLRTHTPSTVVYAPKARFAGQNASGHRLTRQMKGNTGKKSVAVVVDGNNDGMMTEGEALYPWALISKSGRTMGDDCTVHLVNDDAKGSKRGATTASSSSKGIFNTEPRFRGRHGFDDRHLHTHTVVSRTTTSCTSKSSDHNIKDNTNSSNTVSSSGNNASLEEGGPCCVIVRDPTNLDAADITIAPGIDPLLMICYLASHSKMDVEPIMSGF